MRVRPIRPDDAEAFAGIIETVAGEGRWLLTELPWDAAGFARRLRDMLGAGAPDILLLLEDEDGRAVGNLGLHPHEAHPGLCWLGMGIVAASRERGGGRALLAEGLERARATRDWHKVALEVFPWNVRAVSLYAAFGFRAEGLRRRHYRGADGSLRDVLVMGLPLSRATPSRA